ncbi:PREDICTED: uncharacterized protein LOC104712456 [Camelina sativa]|uniref:Uncharacterized protein LOC104712456 n=1 Tax=Camelina sativa TaxID=90675 RepID=A0ABM0TKB3_CAMSA|nr:PREDICTED: uncharacterized protein LOC104712456 [Camelina sativa]
MSHDKLIKYRRISPAPFPSTLPPPISIPVETVSRNILRDKIGVFWDIVDCPIPDGHDPFSVYETITSVMAGEGYRDETMEIRVYGGKKDEIPGKLRYDYLAAGVFYQPEVSGGTCGRVNQMSRDILIWTIDHPEPSNVMVIGEKVSEDKKFRRVLEALKSRHHNIFFICPNTHSLELIRPFVLKIRQWGELFDGRKPIDQAEHS